VISGQRGAYYRPLSARMGTVADTAPSRDGKYDMDWEAHSFLCVSPDAVITPRVLAVAGFRWGFAVRDADIIITGLTALNSGSWDSHLALLRASYPGRTFDPGYVT
jgi:hypothetical protein